MQRTVLLAGGSLLATLGWLPLLFASAGTVLGQRTQLPPYPGPFRVSSIGRAMAGNVRGAVLETRTAADGSSYPVRLTSVRASASTVEPGETIRFRWDDEHPPATLGAPTDPQAAVHPLCIFDDSRRLLAVSYEDLLRQDALLGALGTARVPSRRFSEEELDWAWLAFQSGGGFALPSDPSPGFKLDGFVVLPAHLELHVRFASSSQILDRLASAPALTSDEIEQARICLSNPLLEARAAHVLLSHGVRVDPDSILQADTRLCARLVQRGAEDGAGAEAELLAALEQAERWISLGPRPKQTEMERDEYRRLGEALDGRIPALVEAASHASPEILPRLRTFVRKGVENSTFAWLMLGGSSEELLELVGGDASRIPMNEVLRAGTLEALRLALARFEQALGQRPHEIWVQRQLLEPLIARLRPREPEAVLASVQPVLRAALARVSVHRGLLLVTLLRAGDPQVIAELEEMNMDDVVGLQAVAEALADVPGDSALKILAKILVRALDGFEDDCTLEGPQVVVSIARGLRGRSPTERALALELLDAVVDRPWLPGGLTDLRWALGELPAPERLPRLEMSDVVLSCRLDLAPEAERYAEALVEMRADPRRFWWPLALLADEYSLPPFVAWAKEELEAGGNAFRPFFALDRIASPAAVNPLLDGCEKLPPAALGNCLTMVAKLGTPADLPRLAALSATRSGTESQPFWHAFLILLGRSR